MRSPSLSLKGFYIVCYAVKDEVERVTRARAVSDKVDFSHKRTNRSRLFLVAKSGFSEVVAGTAATVSAVSVAGTASIADIVTIFGGG